MLSTPVREASSLNKGTSSLAMLCMEKSNAALRMLKDRPVRIWKYSNTAPAARKRKLTMVRMLPISSVFFAESMITAIIETITANNIYTTALSFHVNRMASFFREQFFYNGVEPFDFLVLACKHFFLQLLLPRVVVLDVA